MSDEILAIDPDRYDNASLMVACRDLGYLPERGRILDPTYGYGTFWKLWRPALLEATDLDPAKSYPNGSVDFTDMPCGWETTFDTVVFDPPYKLNGTPTSDPGGMDERYGVHNASTWQERHQLIYDGITECVRVLKPKGHLLVKCQAQVVSGAVRWQDRLFADHAETEGCTLIDRFDLLGGRPQPAGRRQVHARRNHSTLLVLRKDR